MSIREELGWAFLKRWGFFDGREAKIATWAAEWMAERIEKECGEYCVTAGDIRQLIKELREDSK